MSFVLLFNQIIVVLIVATGLLLGSWVYFSDRKSRINQLFFAMMFFVLIWITAGFFGTLLLQDSYFATIAVRINWGAVALFFIFTYFLSNCFPIEKVKHKIFKIITVITWSVFFFLAVFTNLIIKNVDVGKYGEWGGEIIFGKGKDFFLLAVVFWTVLILSNLFKKYFSLDAKEKIKTQYFIMALSFFTFFNIIFNVILPLIRNDNKYYQFGDYSAVFIIIFTGMAIVKKELFGVKVILVDLLVSVIGLILLVFPFFLLEPFFKIIGWIIFILFCVFGYLLVRATHREARQKEILEEKVKERTRELQAALDDVKKRKEDLEKFYSLTVGRELKMVELKQQIKELEDKFKNNKL